MLLKSYWNALNTRLRSFCSAKCSQQKTGTRILALEMMEARELLATYIFNFDDQPASASRSSGAFPSLTMESAGLQVMIYRPGSRLDIDDNTANPKPAQFGTRSLDSFYGQYQATPFILNFSHPVNSASILAGDYGEDSPDHVVLEGFSEHNAGGVSLDTDSADIVTAPDDYQGFTFKKVKVESEGGILSLRLIGGTPGFPHSLFYDQLRVEVNERVSIEAARWIEGDSKSADEKNSAVIEIDYLGNPVEGIPYRLFESDNANFDRYDKPLTPVRTITHATGTPFTQRLLLRSPPNGSETLKYVLIVFDPNEILDDSDRSDNVEALPVEQTKSLGPELQRLAPLANSRGERVELWLRKYRNIINRQAALRSIPGEAIAGAIAWEALGNLGLFRRHPTGPGKVHATENNGTSVAQEVESAGYLPTVTDEVRIRRLLDAKWAIRYIAAILGAYADIARRVDPEAVVESRPEILTTLYHGIRVEKSDLPGAYYYPNANIFRTTTVIRLKNAEDYFQYKVRTGSMYAPNKSMGTWVQNNGALLRKILTD